MAIEAYTVAKFVHVLLAIVAVGFNATYGLLIGRASRDPRALPGTLRTVKFMDDFVANPAYALLLVSGGLMVWMAWPLRTLWIELSLGLYVVAVALGLGFYTPTLRKQIDALERRGAASDEYRAVSLRGTVLGIALGVLVVAIVFLMVTKPTL